jgi:hypothetical protein
MNKLFSLAAVLLMLATAAVYTGCTDGTKPTGTIKVDSSGVSLDVYVPFIVHANPAGDLMTDTIGASKQRVAACMASVEFRSQHLSSLIIKASGDACCKNIYVDYQPTDLKDAKGKPDTYWRNLVCKIPMAFSNNEWWTGLPFPEWSGSTTGWKSVPYKGSYTYRIRCEGQKTYTYVDLNPWNLPTWTAPKK